jgi:hypothetical protein
MNRGGRELVAALAAIVLITLIYAGVVAWQGSIPAASQFFGHSLGVLGLVLMLMTEVLYSLRKRSRSARWGRMAGWLQFHIFTGLVGPYLALLHTAWHFTGLAGIVILLTAVIVASGFIGRYIYTAVPRNLDGAEVEGAAIQAQLSASETELAGWMQEQPEAIQQAVRRLLASQAGPLATDDGRQTGAVGLILGRAGDDWRFRREWGAVKKAMVRPYVSQARVLEPILLRRRELRREAASLAATRGLLAIWHSIHIPIGVALFTMTLIHIGAAIYYATLMR